MTTLELIALISVPLLTVIAAMANAADSSLTRTTQARADSLLRDEDDQEETQPEDASDGAQNAGSSPAGVLLTLVDDRVRALAPVWLLSISSVAGIATLIAIIANQRLGGWGVAGVFVIEVIVLFSLVGLGPRAQALTRPDGVVLRLARPIRGAGRSPAAWLAGPLVKLAGKTTSGDDETFEEQTVSEGELLATAGKAALDDAIDADEQQLIQSVIEFGDTRVMSVMVPRPDMVTITSDQSVKAGLELVVQHGFSRFPVIGSGIDDVIGVVHAKDLIAAQLAGNGERPVGDYRRTSHHLPETKHIAKLQREMQTSSFHMGIVVDEYGGTAGLVTLEDLLEELVGEIVDEFDVEEPMIELLPDGARVNGKVSLSDLESLVGERLPEGEWSTVGGLIVSTLGYVPKEGETITLEHHRLEVERVQGRRIARVRLSRHDSAALGTR